MRKSPWLPSKLWQLLELSINSAEELDPAKYALDMAKWYVNSSAKARPTVGATGTIVAEWRDEARCSVCMAGAVMVRVLNVHELGSFSPSAFDPDTESKLIAIDYLRRGMITTAYECLHGVTDLPTHKIDNYLIQRVIDRQDAPWLNDWSAHRALLSELKRLDL